MTRARRPLLAACVVALACVAPPRALLAAPPNPADAAAAEALFDQARKLLDAGKPEQACPKLEESQALDPGIGTLLYLADCYERTGKLASAWARFREAASLAQGAGQADRARIAQARASALDPRLSTLQIDVAPDAASLEGFEVLRDGAVVGKATYGLPLPVDGGPHRIEARARGRKTFAQSINVPPQAGRALVTVPLLEPAPANAPPPPPGSASAASQAPPARPPRDDVARPDPPPGPELGLFAAARLGLLAPGGQTGATVTGTSRSTSSLAGSGLAVEGNLGARFGRHFAGYVLVQGGFLSTGGAVDERGTGSAQRLALGVGLQAATRQATSGGVGFFGDIAFIPVERLSLEENSGAPRGVCSTASTFRGTATRVAGGAHVPLSVLIVSPMLGLDFGRFSALDVDGAGPGCDPSVNGSYSLRNKRFHTDLFAGVGVTFPLDILP